MLHQTTHLPKQPVPACPGVRELRSLRQTHYQSQLKGPQPPVQRHVLATATTPTNAAALSSSDEAPAVPGQVPVVLKPAAAAGGFNDDASPGPLPPHWEEQMRKAPMGRRRVLQRYCEVLVRINALEPRMMALTDDQLRGLTDVFKGRLAGGESLDSLLPEAFAAVREASRRVLGMRHFDCQMIGGMVLHEGQVAEMATGEGKTLVATLPAYLNALTGYSVHIVTVNDYLAARDAESMGKIYTFMGLTCGAVSANMTTDQYQRMYSCDITYVTGQELGFAYLRDNTAGSKHEMVLPPRLHYAIVDEADSILIDESRNPMIISLPVSENAKAVKLVDKVVRPLWVEITNKSNLRAALELRTCQQLGLSGEVAERRMRDAAETVKSQYIKVDQKSRNLTLMPKVMSRVLEGLVEEGVRFRAAEDEGRPPTVTDMFEDPGRWGQLAITAFKAYELYTLGKQYIVKDRKVIIIDESTGRLRDSMRWQDGLHQAVEAKEEVAIKEENHSTATVTFQVFFRFYDKLAGMTGTAAPAAAELFELYGLKVAQVPTNRPIQRADLASRFYFIPAERTQALCNLVVTCWKKGRPILIGTTSVQESERVLRDLLLGTAVTDEEGNLLFATQRDAIQVLNATPEKVRIESQIIAQAGLPGSVTIATNMAGRGTDIILGGSAEGLTQLVLMRLIYRQLMRGDEAASIPSLPYQLKSGPLGVYDSEDLTAAIRTLNDKEGPRLPFDLHTVLISAMLLANGGAVKQGQADSEGGPKPMTYEKARSQVAWVMDKAYKLRKIAYDRIRDQFDGEPLHRLSYPIVIAPVLHDVLMAEEACYVNASKGQQFALKAALHLWAWLDIQCYNWGKEVRKQGGLWVVGTSVQESRRIELQLRGRAGRQGDPGSTIMLYDFNDPYIAIFNQPGMFQMMNDVDKSMQAGQQQAPLYISGVVVETIVQSTQRSVEAQYSNSRLELKRYDEVVEAYRRSVYRLRRLILLGTASQRTQVLYMFIQQLVDELVDKWLGDGSTPAHKWLTPSVPASTLPREVRQASAGATAGGADQQEMVSPLEALMRTLEHMVNPSGRIGRTKWEFRSTGQGGAGGSARSFRFTGILPSQPDSSSSDGKSRPRPSSLTVPLDSDAVELMGPDQMAAVAALITGQPQLSAPESNQTTSQLPLQGSSSSSQESSSTSGRSHQHSRRPSLWRRLLGLIGLGGASGPQSLPWPDPGYRPSAKQELAMRTHARLYGFMHTDDGRLASVSDEVAQGGLHAQGLQALDALLVGDPGLVARAAPGSAQRLPLSGRGAQKVALLRNYLGVILIQAFELRRLTSERALLASRAVPLDLDAKEMVTRNEGSHMLGWLDSVWSVFLDEIESLKKGVYVKAYASGNPLSDFQLGASQAFLAMLSAYRETVVEKVLAPEMKVAVPLDQYTSDPWEEGTLSTKATPQAPSSGRQQPEQQQAQGADDAPSQVLPASVPATQKPSASSNGHIDRIDSTTGNGANLADELTLPSPTRG